MPARWYLRPGASPRRRAEEGAGRPSMVACHPGYVGEAQPKNLGLSGIGDHLPRRRIGSGSPPRASSRALLRPASPAVCRQRSDRATSRIGYPVEILVPHPPVENAALGPGAPGPLHHVAAPRTDGQPGRCSSLGQYTESLGYPGLRPTADRPPRRVIGARDHRVVQGERLWTP